MRKILLTIAACLAAFARAADMDEGVIVLTDANFDEEIAKHENLLVEFYAPWCGHCKKLAPEYAGAAAVLAEQSPPQYVAKCDTTENNALGERFEIKGFPTLVFFRNGKREDYTGGRTKDTIVQWINKKTGPASIELACEFIKPTDSLSAVFFGDFEGELFSLFMDVAKSNEGYTFFHSAGSCAAEHGAKNPSVSVFRSFDQSPVHFDGDNTFAALSQWLDNSSIPKLITFSEDYIEPIFGKGKDALILFTNEEGKAYNQVFKQAAEQLNGEILFVTSGTEAGIQQRLAEFVGVTSEDAPTLRLLNPGEEMKKFVFPGSLDTLSVHAIKSYVDEFKSGALKAHLKTEPEPENNNGPVKILTGTNYDGIVNDASKDVLVKFYAPWCGHCKSLAPIWEELGTAVSEIDSLVISKFDATANEVDGIAIRGYPTLRFYPKDNKAGVEYEGDRDLEGLKDWLSKHSSSYQSHFAKHDEL
jgi:protein disulfide-isomerase A1